MSSLRHWFDPYIVEDFLDLAACARLVDEVRHSDATAALTYGKTDTGIIDEHTRKVRKVALGGHAIASMISKLRDELPRLREHFQLPLADFEEPQFLWYGPGDFFVAHQDGNTGLLQLESDRCRRVSLTIFLNRQSTGASSDSYSGGSLVFTDRLSGGRVSVAGDAGQLIAFRSELTHEVTPITHGDRFVVVTWCRIMSS